MAKKGSKRAAAGRAPAPRPMPGFTGLSTAELQRELGRRQRELGRLRQRREKLQQQLSELDREIMTLGGPAGGGLGMTSTGAPRKRAKNEQNLSDAMVSVLNGKTMSVTQIADAVRDAGYITTSSSFRTIVNQTLIKDPRFKKVSRGQYTVK